MMRMRLLLVLSLTGGLSGEILPGTTLFAQGTARLGAPVAVIVSLEPPTNSGVRVQRVGAADWLPAVSGQRLDAGDLLETDQRSRVLLRYAGVETVPIGPRSILRIEAGPGKARGLTLFRGLLHFFHRGPSDEFEVRSRAVGAIIRGTEFHFQVGADDVTTLTLFDGEVSLTNQSGHLTLRGGEAAQVTPGQAPTRSPFIEASHLLQWRLYYPGVLNLEELRLSGEEKLALSESLAAYRSGDLLTALVKYPTGRQPASDDERIYLSAVLLSVGRVEEVESILNLVASKENRLDRIADALRKIIAAVKGKPEPVPPPSSSTMPESATVWLAESYHEQALLNLSKARQAARRATEIAPDFSFAWARLAELEFGFASTAQAERAVETSLRLAPRNAQAHALRGFLLAAKNQTRAALAAFDEAIAIDPALGNAWLGRGLCRFRVGRSEEGRDDLQVAATLEPNRALLRSYLGKAFSEVHDDRHAEHELDLAKSLDPVDPTSWLYSALIHQKENRINTAVDELERSITLNDQRALYRSRLMLDEDRAVRSSSLANIYRDAGMTAASVREGTRAVSADYGNYSAHLFLAESYDVLRDPTRFNLRYETVWFNERLLAGLLSPVGGTPLSQHITQQEFSRLFERNRLGLTSTTEYRSDGQIREFASQYGVIGNTGWSLDVDYQHNDGVRPNNELDRLEWYATIKQQLSPQDSILLLTKYQDYHSGDNYQHYEPATSYRPAFQFDEQQRGTVVGGYHHEWSPGIHTLLLGGRLANEQKFYDRQENQRRVQGFVVNTNGIVTDLFPWPLDVNYRSEFESFTSELNQVFQSPHWTLVGGARYQRGRFETRAQQGDLAPGLFSPFPPITTTSATEDFERITGYGYVTVKPVEHLWLTAGLAYDQLTYPDNFRHPPITPGTVTREPLLPKAALVWQPISELTLRGAYARSLGGVSFDESFRLEPTQLAGFPQAFRSVISESIVGSVSAPRDEIFGLALDLKLPSRTYVGLEANLIESEIERTIGVFRGTNVNLAFAPLSPTAQRLDYHERSLGLTFNQLLGDDWSLGLSYKLTHAELNTVLPEVRDSLARTEIRQNADRTERADLHHLELYALVNHPSGFFARGETHWYHQENRGYSPALAGDEFFQHNVFVGYRFPRRRAELMLGILNLTGQDYRLNPLTVYAELPRERTFIARFTFGF